AIEERFVTEVREIYGCSEVGSMAVRRTAKTDVWEKFDGLNFSADACGSVEVSADHLPQDVQLEDCLEMLDGQHFRLHGRATDQINIAGKRGSLHEVNRVLSTFPDLLDGVVFFPPQKRAVPRLVALVVFAENGDKRALREHFRKYLDAAFVPRPIIQVPKLPREDNGKLVKDKLLQFYESELKPE
ncbi:MAG: acyl-CoA synthetase, partial [Gammaproteobacteria bacterium]|nr:acyl-CoA synthetase [Gammaproteobacteria bacterium]